MYKVIERFADLLDSSYIYEVGDTYPRKGVQPTPERVEELCGNKNKIGKPLIVREEAETAEVTIKKKPKKAKKN